MAQRLSKAYDDVENYENGFTAHYLTVLNQADVVKSYCNGEGAN